MAHAFLNGAQPLGEVVIPVNVKYSLNGRQLNLHTSFNANYSLKSRQINLSTVFYMVRIYLNAFWKISGHWCGRFLVPIIKSDFISFLVKLIRTLIFTELNLNKHQLYLNLPGERAVDPLRKKIVAKNIPTSKQMISFSVAPLLKPMPISNYFCFKN